jgi:hypothetical protein
VASSFDRKEELMDVSLALLLLLTMAFILVCFVRATAHTHMYHVRGWGYLHSSPASGKYKFDRTLKAPNDTEAARIAHSIVWDDLDYFHGTVQAWKLFRVDPQSGIEQEVGCDSRA